MSLEARHGKQTIENGLHSAISYEYADSTARLVDGPFDSGDKYKIALQLDNNSLWILLDPTIPTWISLNSAFNISGNVDFDGYNIIDVGLINGIDITDHSARHNPGGADALTTATAVGLTANSTSTEGTAASFARSDHTHAIDSTGTLSAVNAGDTSSDGTATGFSRKDHQHAVATATAVAVGTTNAEGSSTSLARADHTHQVTGLAITSQAQGDILYYNGSSWVRLAAGTDGYFLSTNGVGANPSWEAANSSLTTAVPVNVTKSANAEGTATSFARSDHKHDISTAAASGINADSTNTEGSATTVARSDHTHAIDVTTGTISTVNAGDASSDGTAIGLSRRDHQHAVATAAASGLTANSTSTEGSSTSLARADHTHAIDSTGTLSAVNAGDTSSDGTATGFSRKDHQHAVATATAVAVGTANAEGSSTSLARADHTHQVTGLTIASQAQGSILYYNGSAWVVLLPGTDGYALITNGAGQNPEWGQVASSGLTPPLNPSEDGYVAIGLGGNLDYIGGLVDGYVLTWDGDSWGPEILPRRRVTVEFTLTEDVNNTTEWFTTWRSHGGDSPSTKRSGSGSGIQNQNACSPYQVPFNATIVKAIMTLKGAGVQNGSVTYPVTYQTDLYDEGFTSESKIADIDFSISNSFTVGTYSVGSTNYKGSVNLNINVDEAQLLALKFINGVSASLVGQTRNAFVTLILEER